MSDTLNYIAHRLHSFSALTTDEFLSFTTDYKDYNLSQLYTHITQLQNQCANCTRNNYRDIQIDSLHEPKEDHVIFLSSSPKYIDSLFGKSFVSLKDITEENPIYLSGIEQYRQKKELRQKFTQVNYQDLSFTDEKNYLWQVGPNIGPLYTEGQILEYCMKETSLNKNQFTYEYLTRCPKYNTEGDVSYISKKDELVCTEWLKLKVNVLPPKLIVCLGKEPGEYCFGKVPPKNEIFHSSVLNAKCICITSPGVILAKIDFSSVEDIINVFITELSQLKEKLSVL